MKCANPDNVSEVHRFKGHFVRNVEKRNPRWTDRTLDPATFVKRISSCSFSFGRVYFHAVLRSFRLTMQTQKFAE